MVICVTVRPYLKIEMYILYDCICINLCNIMPIVSKMTDEEKKAKQKAYRDANKDKINARASEKCKAKYAKLRAGQIADGTLCIKCGLNPNDPSNMLKCICIDGDDNPIKYNADGTRVPCYDKIVCEKIAKGRLEVKQK